MCRTDLDDDPPSASPWVLPSAGLHRIQGHAQAYPGKGVLEKKDSWRLWWTCISDEIQVRMKDWLWMKIWKRMKKSESITTLISEGIKVNAVDCSASYFMIMCFAISIPHVFLLSFYCHVSDSILFYYDIFHYSIPFAISFYSSVVPFRILFHFYIFLRILLRISFRCTILFCTSFYSIIPCYYAPYFFLP